MDWSISLFEVGDTSLCWYAYCCPCCAAASGLAHVDDSDCCYNCCCINILPIRWLIRTSYGIPGSGMSDCFLSLFLPCCSVNQVLQTALKHGNPTGGDYGRNANNKEWLSEKMNQPGAVDSLGLSSNRFFSDISDQRSAKHAEFMLTPNRSYYSIFDFVQLKLYAALCVPCSVGVSLEDTLGMPFCIGCCCVNPCSARHLLRYQYRLRGHDIRDECIVPGAAVGLAGLVSWACSPLCLLGLLPCMSLVASETAVENEWQNRVRGRRGGLAGKYTIRGYLMGNTDARRMSPREYESRSLSPRPPLSPKKPKSFFNADAEQRLFGEIEGDIDGNADNECSSLLGNPSIREQLIADDLDEARRKHFSRSGGLPHSLPHSSGVTGPSHPSRAANWVPVSSFSPTTVRADNTSKRIPSQPTSRESSRQPSRQNSRVNSRTNSRSNTPPIEGTWREVDLRDGDDILIPDIPVDVSDCESECDNLLPNLATVETHRRMSFRGLESTGSESASVSGPALKFPTVSTTITDVDGLQSSPEAASVPKRKSASRIIDLMNDTNGFYPDSDIEPDEDVFAPGQPDPAQEDASHDPVSPEILDAATPLRARVDEWSQNSGFASFWKPPSPSKVAITPGSLVSPQQLQSKWQKQQLRDDH